MCIDTTAAYGMYPRNVALSDVVCALNRAGFAKEDICMVLSPAHPDAAAVRDSSTFDTSVSDGGSARTIRWFSGFGAVVIPTIGFLRDRRLSSKLCSANRLDRLCPADRRL